MNFKKIITKFHRKKIICESCQQKLPQTTFSKQKICTLCYMNKLESEKIQNSKENWEYIEKNIKDFFVINHIDRNPHSTYRVAGFDTLKKEPCIRICKNDDGRKTYLLWSYSHITFDELKEYAKEVSSDTYEKIKNIDVNNWEQFVENID